MTVRGFYHTLDGDQIPITFSYDEEKQAFESALVKLGGIAGRLKNYADGNVPYVPGPSDPGKPFLTVDGFEYRADPHGRLIASRKGDIPFFTTLETEQLRRNVDIFMAIYGLNVCNVHSRSNMDLCIYTNCKWKEGKWIQRA